MGLDVQLMDDNYWHNSENICVCVFCLKRLGSLPNIHFDTENVDQPNQPSDALEFRSQDLQSET